MKKMPVPVGGYKPPSGRKMDMPTPGDMKDMKAMPKGMKVMSKGVKAVRKSLPKGGKK